MIPHTNSFFFRYGILAFLLLAISCGNTAGNNSIGNDITVSDSAKTTTDAIPEQIPALQQYQGAWHCYKYIKDSRYKEDFDDNYAEEISKHASLQINDNALSIDGYCKSTLYEYKYPVNRKKYEDESVFITYFKPKTDSVLFLSNYGTGPEECNAPYKTLYLHGDDLIVHDRGYFFFFNRQDKKAEATYTIKGIAGDNRGEWEVVGVFRTEKLEEAYKTFKKDFPYGSLKLAEKLPGENYSDNGQGVYYTWDAPDQLTISKDDPNGTISISLTKQKDAVKIAYAFKYPKEG